MVPILSKHIPCVKLSSILILAALARINVVSGPGMLASINSQSLEKLVLDNEICASAYRLIEGVDIQGLDDIAGLVGDVGTGGQFLNQKHTRSYVRKEHHFPSDFQLCLPCDPRGCL